jgi:5-methyltetrahydrofolate--homocysteine methyltransferase
VKAAVVGARRAMTRPGAGCAHRPGHRRAHRHDAARLEIGAALTALEPLGIDVIGMNCATGPAEMSEHLRYLSQHARCRCR